MEQTQIQKLHERDQAPENETAIGMPKLPPKLPRHLSGEAAWLPPSCFSRSIS